MTKDVDGPFALPHTPLIPAKAGIQGCDREPRESRPGSPLSRGRADTPEQILRTPAQLCEHGFIPADKRDALEKVAARYAVALPPALAALIDRTDPADPIARQFVPDVAELEHRPEENTDPIGDDSHSPVDGIVHRYPDRVLLKLTHICAVYCRFCFRREMVGPGAKGLSSEALARALDYLAAHSEIWEVILTGGDPLVLSPRRLRAVMESLADIAHVKVVRIHTRVPVAAPAHVTPALVRAMKASGKATYVAVHVNHPRELSAEARAGITRMADNGLVLLGQSVLLKGVNDDPEVLGALMRAMVECRIKPYYLHHADLAPGTAHLRTDIATGQFLMRGLRGRFSGLCQPAYVLDIPGGHGKSPIGPAYIEQADDEQRGAYIVEDYTGRPHVYPAAENGLSPRSLLGLTRQSMRALREQSNTDVDNESRHGCAGQARA